MMENVVSEAPGWAAIDAAFERLYPGQKDIHLAAVPPPGAGGDAVLNGVSIYQGAGDMPHWHYVTYGLTELFDKQSDDPSISGFGFELTFRLKQGEETEPPRWPFEMLQNLGRYVFSTGCIFEAGHFRQRLAPILQDTETQIFSLIFVADPELPQADTPNGKLNFVQVVGITNDEMDAVWNVGVKTVEALLARRSPKLVTDITRSSVLTDPGALRAVHETAEHDGSPTEMIYVDHVAFERHGSSTTIVFSATTIRSLLAVLPYRWRFGRPFSIICGDYVVTWQKGERNVVRRQGEPLQVILNDAGYQEFVDTMHPVEGTYTLTCLPELKLRVDVTEIRDTRGRVVYRIGAAR